MELIAANAVLKAAVKDVQKQTDALFGEICYAIKIMQYVNNDVIRMVLNNLIIMIFIENI